MLFFDGKLLLKNEADWTQGETFFGMGSKEQIAVVNDLEKGRTYNVEIRSWARIEQRSSPVKIGGAIRFGAVPVVDDQQAILEAVEVAKTADNVIVVVGLNEDFECEGHDRKTME